MPESKRRLAAIMFSDIVGYTSLMGDDEKKALEILNTNLEIHRRHIDRYNGEIVKELGDGLLSVFENGTEAVQCAIKIQQEAGNSDIPLRVGIHEGEVVLKNSDVFGDGVNIASRIQEEAACGGICISDSVYRIIKNKTDIKVKSLGTRHLKNVNDHIRLYQVIAEGVQVSKDPANRKKLKVLIWPVALVSAVLIFIAGWLLNEKIMNTSSIQIEKYDIVLPSKAPVVCRLGVLPVSISPDGTLIVYQAYSDNKMSLYKRYINEFEALPIPGTENGQVPFFSPDGKWIGFFADGLLKKVPLSNGDPVELVEVTTCSSGIWMPDNAIIVSIIGQGLVRIPSSGGDFEEVTSVKTEIGEWIHDHPTCLPDGETMLYGVTNASGDPLYIKSVNLKNGYETIVAEKGSYPIYHKSGFLIFAKNGDLMAAPFDPKELKLGDPVMIMIENIVFQNPSISLSNNGTLVYVQDQAYQDNLVWVDLKGHVEKIFSDNTQIAGPRISPDGNKIALWKTDQVYIYDLVRQSLDQFTNTGGNFWPVWSPDGRHIAFPSMRGGTYVDIYWKSVNSGAPALSLLNLKNDADKEDYIFQPQMWSNDGRYLLFVESKGLVDDWDIMMLDMTNEGEISAFIATGYDERHPRLSPDNRWVAYQSRESGQYEIYITTFPEREGKQKVSISGGIDPLWDPEGKKIYYRKDEQVLSVDISTEGTLSIGKPKVMFSGRFRKLELGWYYDLHPDGDKFVMVQEAEIDTTQNRINIIKNFAKEIDDKLVSSR